MIKNKIMTLKFSIWKMRKDLLILAFEIIKLIGLVTFLILAIKSLITIV